ncbi:hypothetical protein AB0F25_30690 [Streptomyces wedmorensis]|uniref:hypothetical protein n=1 Tax=Streptomyces wedmorensis TaxID=43759 RepID=UPI003447DD2B
MNQYPETLDDEEGGEKPNELRPGDSVSVLVSTRYNPTGTKLILTNMTHEELVALREIWEHAFDLAEPVVVERDRVAREAFERGDDSNERVYRAPPAKVVRRRQE